MKILIQIARAHHERLLSQLIGESALYYTLMNGAKIERSDAGGTSKFIEFVCDAEEARRLVETAKQCCPEAAAQIEAGKTLSLRGR